MIHTRIKPKQQIKSNQIKKNNIYKKNTEKGEFYFFKKPPASYILSDHLLYYKTPT